MSAQAIARWNAIPMTHPKSSEEEQVSSYMHTKGRVDPIPFQVKNDLTGLGKNNQDFRMIETTVSQRREMDSERQRKETEDQRKSREDVAAKRAAVRSEITDTLRPFYCALCEKQFQNVAQYDEHTNSYAHHHKARLKDMQANARLVNQDEVEKRKEKERKREEKELRKLAKAQGIKMAKPPAIIAAPGSDTGITSEPKPSGFKKAGWASVSTAPEPPEIKRSGWATINSAVPSFPQPPAPPRHSSPPPPLLSRSFPASSAPTFHTAGWTSLDTSSPETIPPPPPPVSSYPPPPPPFAPTLPSHSVPADVSLPPSPPNIHNGGGWTPVPPPSNIPPPFPPSGPARPGWSSSPALHSSSQPPPPMSLRVPVPPPAAQAKSGWQQWKQGNSLRRR
ncbi:hypothetical protein PAXINDRAFT_102524 [Paxillus involutus ATCC 200175]|uniref:C2H2-type domain-containing protein n=1 Tax=Paxillus involutus ATCC 200175 TaxID=664439 RepID=A0A0C9SZA8_PAXIN|nr:hypothetical protein PAXINDRAFT_102524 [Paxillus involutus ATCC 200175]